MTPLSSRSALVTGSTDGIGWGIAQALAESGANVMLNGFGDLAAIEEKRRALAAATGVGVRYHPADVTDPAQVRALVEATATEFGAVDIVVNNAGIQHVSAVESFPDDRWEALQRVILHASFHAIKAAVPGMKARGWGRIINLVSVHGLVASPFKSAYVAAKHGQIGLTRTVALETAEHGITCNAICPGYVRTALVENQIRAQAAAHGISEAQVVRDVMLAAQPTRRFVEVAEVAALAIFLCGEHARSITGAAIPLDGGWTAR